ncbi:alpha/beta hydrolase [Clostridium oryzae]|uniref:Carboxylesterase NlhH n=1 Tax=Clostridium oryzae TaxID=1450648 RepID=A0A1V4IVG2_9CLOT|nr:alpha/beta hydrolase [Clostridium oryzae]OPJ64021.1 carboxylesterase NlhH [Clostridium oryzae]
MIIDEKVLGMIKNMRQGDKERTDRANIIGSEEFIPTRAGKTRVLVYKTENSTSLSPVFFDVHGGGFIAGLPEDDDRFCDELRKELNITVISIDYRLAPDHMWPAGINDTYDVVEYVSLHKEEFGIDSDNMAIGGHSAGANISTVVCMLAKQSGKFSFKCQVLDYPPLDVATPGTEKFYIEGAIPPEVAAMFDKCYRKDEEAKNPHCSPVYASNEELKGLPPAVVITCEIDSLRDEGEDYAQKLIKAGVETIAKRFYGVWHGFTIGAPDLKESKEAYRMIADGVKKYLGR